jgi:hypothetical protein
VANTTGVRDPRDRVPRGREQALGGAQVPQHEQQREERDHRPEPLDLLPRGRQRDGADQDQQQRRGDGRRRLGQAAGPDDRERQHAEQQPDGQHLRPDTGHVTKR